MAQPAVRTIRVSLTDHAIEPREIQVPANYPITFVVENTGSRKHELAVPDAGYSVDVLPGQTCAVTWTFVDVGEFQTVSRDDEDQRHGLKGKLLVETLI
jgi:heme/copper-type cytochrome/quinol oxidase subunit 2